jgi:acyl-CoA synthetase (AMP-forming)/AMP-acid ligase II
MLDWLLDRMAEAADAPAIADGAHVATYRELLARVKHWQRQLSARGISGRVVSIEAEYGAEAVAVFLAATSAGNVLVPISAASHAHRDDFLEIAEVEYRLRLDLSPVGGPDDQHDAIVATGRSASHAYYKTLQESGNPGLVLFSSGSTGKHKAAVHDLKALLKKFSVPRHCYRTLVFLQLDHIGGVNTLFYTLSNAGAVVVSEGRTPRQVCEAIAAHRVELLPTSPTFLNLLLLSEEQQRHDLSSLKLITYGTEPMPENTLRKVHAVFPEVKLLQTYGLSELGILRSQSRDSGSLWMRVGGEGFETKIVDGRLFIRASSAMLGYLNAPNPFDAEGFFDTGDLAEVDGEWLRILGRKSEIINVGGNKVFPLEVENALLALANVEDVSVHGEPNPITGQVVVATVRLTEPEEAMAFKTRMKLFCAGKLAGYKVPAKVRFVDTLHSERFKKVRGNGAAVVAGPA